MTIKRRYNYRDAEMLLAAKTIAGLFSENVHRLAELRSNWTPEYAEDLSLRIDKTIDTFLGTNKKDDLLKASRNLEQLASSALRDLRIFRLQVKSGYKDQAGEILFSLGFTSHYQKARRYRSQEALISNLAAFNSGMSLKLKTKLISDGMNPDLIERVIASSHLIREANTLQEVLKASTLKITANAIQAFNEIHLEVSGICRIIFSHTSLSRSLREQFSFSKVTGNMSQAKDWNADPALQ